MVESLLNRGIEPAIAGLVHKLRSRRKCDDIMPTIQTIQTRDVRFALKPGEGADSVHRDPQYSYAVTLLTTDNGLTGTGLAFTLGDGNDLVCGAIELLADPIRGQDLETLMADFGVVCRKIADHPQIRWLGPHKGIVHLALASIVNACFDLWAKARGVPLWKLLIDLTPEQVVALLDLSYLDDVLTPDQALDVLRSHQADRSDRESVLQRGYPGYDTSVGWFQYGDDELKAKAREAMAEGFGAVKIKVGSRDARRDIRRAFLLRETVGPDTRIMLDANQSWPLPAAISACEALADMDPYWVEEPTHPDDVLAHQTLARAIAPIPVAMGEHVPNRVLFKNYMQAGAAEFIQVDCVRVAGISEFITVSLMARRLNLKVAPHVGDMGQIHQHLVLFNHIALGHERLFLEYIPHLREHFLLPARVSDGVYRTPQEPGSSSDLKVGRTLHG